MMINISTLIFNLYIKLDNSYTIKTFIQLSYHIQYKLALLNLINFIHISCANLDFNVESKASISVIKVKGIHNIVKHSIKKNFKITCAILISYVRNCAEHLFWSIGNIIIFNKK